ncbi:PIN domain-containing protein [Spiribacter insolitus]|uniref:Ribonuclease VapC n=1 Tax=Spiribacter insolitus TaxID=3122417 RepID=A0ABV3T8B2_9GAMM
MMLLDTNVLSALMQSTPDERVVQWLDQQPADEIWLSTITIFEARYGLQITEDGRRRQRLESQFEMILAEDLGHRVLVFDQKAADAAATLAAGRRRHGRPVDTRDTFIAGIAIANQAAIATGNMRHFSDLRTPVVNPWAAA